ARRADLRRDLLCPGRGGRGGGAATGAQGRRRGVSDDFQRGRAPACPRARRHRRTPTASGASGKGAGALNGASAPSSFGAKGTPAAEPEGLRGVPQSTVVLAL